jgi:predicted O-linked N-acetylglucosamine transferase (SPINDLY family)
MFLGMALADLGRHTEAEPHLSRALKKAPHQAEAWENLARCQQAIGNLADAVASMERFVSIQPANASAHEQLGELVAAANGFPAAEPHFRKALALDPSMAAAASNLGVSLIEQPSRIAEGMECFDKALQLDPFLTSASAARALGLMRLYKTEESLDLQNSILWMEPSNTSVLSARNMLLNYPSSQDRHAIFEAHREFGTHFTDWEAPVFFNPPEPDKPLRVGFVSPDLRSHPVAAFLLPLLKHLDPSRMRVFLYHSHHTEDATSKALANHAVKWTNLNGLTDDLAAELIRKDAPDILIDLAGHSAMNRLPLFARYLAPVQLTYLGYPNTTGLPAITHRLVDSITDPTGDADTLSTERLIRFSPCAWAYEPPADAPEPRMPEPPQPITFACFNNFLKVSDATLATWATLLDQCPGARLLLKSQYFDDPAVRESVTEKLASSGITPDRTELLGFLPTTAEHLATYQRVHVALDPFPYNGTTTTCEALWMGVPVVSLAGDRHASRVGLSLLTAADHADWAVETPAAYIAKAIELANAPATLAQLRTTLRSDLKQSDLLNHPTQATRLESALRTTWQNWCTSQTPN